MNLILFDDKTRIYFYPLAFTRPLSELRMGISTNTERWMQLLQLREQEVSWHSEAYLEVKYPTRYTATDNLLVNGAVIGTPALARAVSELARGEALYNEQQEVIAVCLEETAARQFLAEQRLPDTIVKTIYSAPLLKVRRLWHLFQGNAEVLRADFVRLTAGQVSAPLSGSNRLIGSPDNLYIAADAVVEGAILNVKDAPIYIAGGAEVMEGSVVRGGLALGEGAQLKMGTKVYGATTIGQHSKIGGEVSNSILQGFSNKGHDGFIGNSILGEWCNLGAGTNSSNLKNNYGEVQVWNYESRNFERTGSQFCGLIMGDHSKCAIATMFNTGTVVGVFANIFGDGFPRKFIPSFSWGGAKGFSTYQLDKAFETAQLVMERRHIALTEADQSILRAIFEHTAEFRAWDKTAKKDEQR